MNKQFDPIQPFFVLGSGSYLKSIPKTAGVAHFYKFTGKDTPSGQNAIIPDGAIDIIFACDSAKPQAFVAGSVERASANVFEENTVYFGARLVPGVLDRFGRVSAKELVSKNVSFVEATGNREVFERICAAQSFEEQKHLFTMAFEEQLSAGMGENKTMLVAAVLDEIFKYGGNVQVSELERILNYSRRHLSRVFGEYTGLDIKSFANIIRFQNAISGINHGVSQKVVDLSQNSGYYDQSHFRKDFRKFTAMTPLAYKKLIAKSDYLNKITII